MDPRFLTTDYVVEATNAEQFFLWKLHHEQVNWEQGNSGVILHIGDMGGVLQKKRPVNIQCYWNRINGMNVLFWYACSQVVDHKMIDEWFEANCYPYEHDTGRHASCDAENFHNCIAHSKSIKELVEKGIPVPPQTYYKKTL